MNNRLSGFVIVVLLFLFAGIVKAVNAEETVLRIPESTPSYQFTLSDPGIYELSYAQLETAGFPVSIVNPHALTLMTQGNPVAYQVIGDNDTSFEENEAIRFMGADFIGSKNEKLFIDETLYWLWADDNAGGSGVIDAISAPHASATPLNIVSKYLLIEPDNTFSSTLTDDWDTFENEFDVWYWTKVNKVGAQPLTRTLDIELASPANTVPNATADLTVEVLTKNNTHPHVMAVSINNDGWQEPDSWEGTRSEDLNQTVNASALQDGTNELNLHIFTAGTDRFYLNNAEIAYDAFVATKDMPMQFGIKTAGSYDLTIQNDGRDPASLIMWDITDPNQPLAIDMNTATVTAETITLPVTAPENAQFFLTATDIMQSVSEIKTMVANDIQPDTGAEWLAITHADFMTETIRLADYRQSVSGYSTYVIDVDEIYQQYGFGYRTPHAIQSYLKTTMSWSTPPKFVVLVGDATFNPLQKECSGCGVWPTDEVTYIPTFLLPIDRFAGGTVTDHPFSTLIGDDAIPDVPVGRLPVSSLEEANILINKIITYESNLNNPDLRANDLVFTADKTDTAGPFCTTLHHYEAYLPDGFDIDINCMDEMPKEEVRAELFRNIEEGVLISQYTGHGSVGGWGVGILGRDDIAQLNNIDKPFVQISGNCVDGHFAYPGKPALADALLVAPNGGTASHWGATTYGFLPEHDFLHGRFFDAVFDENILTMGEAIQYAKVKALEWQWMYEGQVYASTLLGDPAMKVMNADMALSVGADSTQYADSGVVTVTVLAANAGVLPTVSTLDVSVPQGATLLGNPTASVPVTVTSTANGVVIETQERVGFTEAVTVEMVVQVDAPLNSEIENFVTVQISAPGDENPNNDVVVANAINTQSVPTSVTNLTNRAGWLALDHAVLAIANAILAMSIMVGLSRVLSRKRSR